MVNRIRPFFCDVLLLLGLLFIIPSIMYVNAIDWSKKHSSRIAALPIYSNSFDNGKYRLKANNLEFLIRVKGMQNDGHAVILLHGFPESSLMWQPLLDQAASEGYRVLAFDQRGYSPNTRPKAIEDYQIDRLVEGRSNHIQIAYHNFWLSLSYQ